MSEHDDELTRLLDEACYCFGDMVCWWHKQLRNGGPLTDLINTLNAFVVAKALSEALDEVCTCDDATACKWHRWLAEGASPEDVLMEIDELPDRSADPDYFEGDCD